MEVEYLADEGSLNLAELFDMHIFTIRGNFTAVREMTVNACHIKQLHYSGCQSASFVLNSHDTVHAVSRCACFRFIVVLEDILGVSAEMYTDVLFLVRKLKDSVAEHEDW
jgi:hypothetical protein